MKLRARDPNSLREIRFDVHAHVFERLIPFEFSRFDLLLESAQSIVDLVPIMNGL